MTNETFPRLRYFFKELRREVAQKFPKADHVALRIDEDAGGSPRSFAWCEYDSDTGACAIAVATKLEVQDDDRIEGIMRHEFGHALDFLYERKVLEKKFRGSLPTGAERRADLIAECVWGDPINYDNRDVQTIGPGKRPRPYYLPR